jgi:hypothetical protein
VVPLFTHSRAAHQGVEGDLSFPWAKSPLLPAPHALPWGLAEPWQLAVLAWAEGWVGPSVALKALSPSLGKMRDRAQAWAGQHVDSGRSQPSCLLSRGKACCLSHLFFE